MMRHRLAKLIALALALSVMMLPTFGAQAHNGRHADNSKYVLVKTPLNWRSANAAARRMVAPGCRTAHLATITSAGEQAVVVALMGSATGERNAWLGGFQPRGELRTVEGWRWITGERFVVGDAHWAGGEPNDNPDGTFIPGSEQNLETLNGDGGSVVGAWNDAPGFEEKFFIVESEHCV